jgi:hypothetical protein
MAVNITIDDTSPLLVYVGNWADQNPVTDSDRGWVDSFYNATYHVTGGSNATVSLTFTGTTVTAFGAKINTYVSLPSMMDDGVVLIRLQTWGVFSEYRWGTIHFLQWILVGIVGTTTAVLRVWAVGRGTYRCSEE